MAYRILVLQSVRDEAAARCEQQVSETPSLRAHEFEFMYVAAWAPLDETMSMGVRVAHSEKSSLDEQELLRRLNKRVESFRPDVLLVQSGALFHRHLEQMLFVLQAVKAAHPTLRLGFQPRPFEQHGPRPFFEYSPEMHELLRKVLGEAAREHP